MSIGHNRITWKIREYVPTQWQVNYPSQILDKHIVQTYKKELIFEVTANKTSKKNYSIVGRGPPKIEKYWGPLGLVLPYYPAAPRLVPVALAI